MQEKPAKLEWLIWGVLGLVMVGILGAFVFTRLTAKKPLPIIRELPEFALTNQFGERVSLADVRGSIFIADIIFTRCPGPCLQMTKRMSRLQSELPEGVKLISLTADPAFDTATVLKKYGERFNATSKRWQFLTGPKKDVYALAMDGLLLAVQEKPEGEKTSIEDMFIHSTTFILVDAKGRVRNFYESAEPEAHDRVMADVKQLLREP